MITQYEYTDPERNGWRFEPIELGKENLIVGASGVGKTRFLNSIFNIALFIVRGQPFIKGTCKLNILVGGYEYEWEYGGNSHKPNEIRYELLRVC